MGRAVPQLRVACPVGGAFSSDVPASYRKSEAIAGHPYDVDSVIANAGHHKRHTGASPPPTHPRARLLTSLT